MGKVMIWNVSLNVFATSSLAIKVSKKALKAMVPPGISGGCWTAINTIAFFEVPPEWITVNGLFGPKTNGVQAKKC